MSVLDEELANQVVANNATTEGVKLLEGQEIKW